MEIERIIQSPIYDGVHMCKNANNPNTKPKTKDNKKTYRRPVAQIEDGVVIQKIRINQQSIYYEWLL